MNQLSATATTTVNIQDINDPPNCDLVHVNVAALWPPNHTMVPVSIVGVFDPNDDDTIAITGITQDEPVNGLGDGDTSLDAVIQHGIPADIVLLRAERSSKGDGRIYQVSFRAYDAEGGCSSVVKVVVPHEKNHTAIDSGQAVDSTQP